MRRLLREQPAPPGQAAQQVQRQRQHLERDEHGQQVVGGREEHHAADREQRQREDLGVHEPGGAGASRSSGLPGVAAACAANAAVAGVADEQHADEGEHQHGALDEQRRPVDRDGAHRGDVARAALGVQAVHGGHHDRQDERGGQRAEREHQVHGAADADAARTPRPGRRPRAAPKTTSIGASCPYSMLGALMVPALRAMAACAALRQGGVRRGARRWSAAAMPVTVGPRRDAAGFGSVVCTCAIVTLTAGLMTSSTGFG